MFVCIHVNEASVTKIAKTFSLNSEVCAFLLRNSFCFVVRSFLLNTFYLSLHNFCVVWRLKREKEKKRNQTVHFNILIKLFILLDRILQLQKEYFAIYCGTHKT